MRAASRDALATAQERLDAVAVALPAGPDGEIALTEVGAGLFAVAGLLQRQPSLRRAVTDQGSDAEARAGLAARLLSDQVIEPVLGVVDTVVRARWSESDDVVAALERLGGDAYLRHAETAAHLDDVEDELFRFARIVEREPSLRAALASVWLPDERKTALLDDLVGDRVRPETQALLRHTVTQVHDSVEHAVDELVRIAAARRHRQIAVVRSAVPLDDAATRRLGAALARVLGQEVALRVDVDPAVLGGMEVRVGDETMDGTIARRLEEAWQRFAPSGRSHH